MCGVFLGGGLEEGFGGVGEGLVLGGEEEAEDGAVVDGMGATAE